ncbi:MAG: hypothetical protein NC336_00510 [Clostridium sp.]|nr:hypothetical protein [Clostridium sp.]
MTRKEFIERMTSMVSTYLEDVGRFDNNPQIIIDPATMMLGYANNADLLSGIADNDEAVEAAAGADQPADEDATDRQVRRNPDFYAIFTLLTPVAPKKFEVNRRRIEEIADTYPALT